MASTMMLMKTRGEWTNAVTNGETDLTHAEYADKKEQEELNYKKYNLEQSVKQKPSQEPEKFNPRKK